MHNLVIGIPTYKRPLMLEKLILSIYESNINKSLIGDINIIIMDNDSDRSAEKTVIKLSGRNSNSCKLFYFNYPVKGLSSVRNELFARAIDFNPDYIVGIDDDEYVSPEWLNQLTDVAVSSNAEIILGPVIPVFEKKVSPYISFWFRYQNLANNQPVNFFWTGNFIINTKFLSENKLKFDERFNSTGSEDSYFGVQALNKGAIIRWANDAIAYETITDRRAKLKWLIKRSYNHALTYTYILRLKKDYKGLLKKLLISIAYLICGCIAIVIVFLPVRSKYWGILKFSESIGAFAALFGAHYHEYSKDR
jgi:succinoglycan biosynthesis protein ExoM